MHYQMDAMALLLPNYNICEQGKNRKSCQNESQSINSNIHNCMLHMAQHGFTGNENVLVHKLSFNK